MAITVKWKYTPTRTREYTSLAADAKTTVNMPSGSTWLETDTGKQYVFNGSAWVQVAGTIVVDGVKETAETQETGSVGAIGWLSSIKGFLRKVYATLGITTGAKVVTDAAGTVQQYLRGLVSLAVSGFNVIQATAASLNATVTPAGWTPTAELTAGTNVVKGTPGILHGFLVETGGTNDITVQFYNHGSTATTAIIPSIVVPGGDNYGGAMGIDITCSVGIVCVHSGDGGIVTAYYK